MSAELQKFLRLKKLVQDKQREADQAQGEYNGIMKQLKAEFGCETLEDAEKLLKQARADEEAAEKAFKLGLRKFEKRWEKFLES